jgi:hypothetical protein
VQMQRALGPGDAQPPGAIGAAPER